MPLLASPSPLPALRRSSSCLASQTTIRRRRSYTMKAALPRTMLLKVADYLEADAEQLEASYWDPAVNRVTPRSMWLEVERVRKWVTQIRAASQPAQVSATG